MDEFLRNVGGIVMVIFLLMILLVIFWAIMDWLKSIFFVCKKCESDKLLERLEKERIERERRDALYTRD